MRYPRDKAPAEPPLAAEVPPIAYGTWEMLRQGKQCAILAVGVMCEQALVAATLLAAEGLDVSVVNARFLKPVDRTMLDALVANHSVLVTVEDGCVVNGFGASLAAIVERVAPGIRVIALGSPDRTYEHAPRPAQLAEAGLTPEGIAARIRALHAEEAAVS
jgi:1-deoxy-D-xylulose-5-phosphate synthase